MELREAVEVSSGVKRMRIVQLLPLLNSVAFGRKWHYLSGNNSNFGYFGVKYPTMRRLLGRIG